MTYVATATESVTVLRVTDHIRVIVRIDDTTGDSHNSDLRDAAVRIAAWAIGLRPTVRSWSPYQSRRMQIATNLAGNLIFMGDSAHVTTTRGGMNMNAGIHDAAAIASALARDPARFAAAADERLTVARDVLLPRTHETLDDLMARLRLMVTLDSDPKARREFLRRSAMLDMVAWP